MYNIATALAALLFASSGICARSSQNPPGKDALLLSNVQSLTLRGDRLTSSRRVSPIPQLNCVGPSKKICDMYQIDTMRCTNEGHDYDAEDVQWTCTASLPPEFKLGATDVVCEGYRSSEDQWVLKGSCGVEYRLLLTEQGEQRFGKTRSDTDRLSGMGRGIKKSTSRGSRNLMEWLGELIFWGFFVAVALFIFVPLISRLLGWQRNQIPRQPRRGWRGFGGFGGGGGDGDYPPGPPPPYSRCSDDNGFAFGGRSSSQGWSPGFWTGILGGAAAGYQMGRRAGNGGSPFQRTSNFGNGEGSSRSRSPPTFSSARTSTGFGSTNRR